MDSIDIAADFAHEAIDKIAAIAKQAFSGKGQRLNDAERQVISDCRQYVYDNPMTSTAIAVTAGFFLSRLLINR